MKKRKIKANISQKRANRLTKGAILSKKRLILAKKKNSATHRVVRNVFHYGQKKILTENCSIETPHHRAVHRRLWSIIAIGLTLIALSFQFFISPLLAATSQKTISSQADWEAGEYWNNSLDTKTTPGSLSMKAGAGGTWDSSTPALPEYVHGAYSNGPVSASSSGQDMVTDGSYLYLTSGTNTPDFWRYAPETNTWKHLALAPTGFGYNTGLTYANGYIYAINGHSGNETLDATSELWRYDIVNDSWTRLANAPGLWGSTSTVGGGDIEYGNNGKIYAVQGNYSARFWVYTIATNTWSDGPALLDGIGGSLNHTLAYSTVTFDWNGVTHCVTGCIYAISSSFSTYHFDIALGQWYSAVNIQVSPSLAFGQGASIVNDPSQGVIYGFRGSSTAELMKFTPGNPGTWSTTPTDPNRTTFNAALAYLNGYIYATFTGSADIGRYNPTPGNGTWDILIGPSAFANGNTQNANQAVFVPSGTDCADPTGCFFLQSSNSNLLYRYDISTSTWTARATTPAGTVSASGTCYDNNGHLYISRGSGFADVYPYNIGTNTYGTTLTAPGNLGVGSSIACTGNSQFYLLQGGASSAFYYFNGATITNLTSDPINSNGVVYKNVSYGGALGWDGTYVYALIGSGRPIFLRYNPGATSGSRWTEQASLPTSTGYSNLSTTAVLEYDGVGNIFAVTGNYERTFFRYNIAGNTWTQAADLPARAGYGFSLTRGNAAKNMYFVRGWSSYSIYKFNVASGTYPTSATWISAPIDLNYASSFTNFSDTSTTSGSATIAYQSRTSTNGSAWSTWATISGGNITSPAGRYIQIKVVMADATMNNTPSLSDFTITYTKDSTAPTNPTVTGYTDPTKTTSLGANGNITAPYFEWAAPVESESAISGYYVQWTTNASADPSSSPDNFQTTTSYRVNTSMSRSGSGTTWYLRLATVDTAGNVSAPQSKYSYIYQGISSTAHQTWTSQADFTSGTSSSVDTSTSAGDIKLNHISSGAFTSLPPLPATSSTGGGLANDGLDTIYYLPGSSGNLYSYSITTKLFTSISGLGSTVSNGGTILYVPRGNGCADSASLSNGPTGCLYITPGNNTNTFRRYRINDATWETLATLPVNANFGATITYDGNASIYYMPSNGTPRLYKYTINASTGTWSAPLADTDSGTNFGNSLAFVPSGSYCADSLGCLYALQGGGSAYVLRYDISRNSWFYSLSFPGTLMDGSSMVYLNGSLYVARGIQNEVAQLDLATMTWKWLPLTPTTKGGGGTNGLTYVASTNSFYLLRSSADYAWYSFDLSASSWNQTPGLPNYYAVNGYSQGILAYDQTNDIVYIDRGNTGSTPATDFWAYAPSTSNWTQLTDFPRTPGNGMTGEYVNHATAAYRGVYALSGNDTIDSVGYFYRYSPATGWTRLANAPGNPGIGTDLIYDGDNALYTSAGSTTAWWKYDIPSDTWTNLTGVNQPVWNSTGGGSCGYKIGSYIYLIRGGNTQDIYRYSLTNNTWDATSTLNFATAGITGGGCFLDGQGSIVAARGSSTSTVYSFNPANGAKGTWTTLPANTVSNWLYGNMVLTSNNVALGFSGNTGSNMLRYVVATNTTGYAASGSWTSNIVDLNSGTTNGVYAFANLQVSMTGATNTNTIVETRTCANVGCASDANNVNWGAWTTATNKHISSGVDAYTINSSVARYAQTRVRIQSDQVLSPTISDVTWNYYQDSATPTNPTAPVNGYTDSSKVTPVTNAEWSSSSAPYFEWTATDDANGIGVGSFYVYFGTNATKDPVTDAADPTNLAYKNGTNIYAAVGGSAGSWNAATQSSASLTNGVYYLRIRTADLNNNIAAADTDFTYKLDKDAPADPSGLSVTPSGYSASNSYTFTWTGSTDSGPSGVSQYCYKTNGGDTCVNAGTICSGSSCSINGISAYQTRVNTFSLRAKDGANNYSAYSSTSYYYAGNPPTEPTAITVTPNSRNNDNSYQVSWQLPGTCLGQTPCDTNDILRYCYTINHVPSAITCGTNYGGNPSPSPDGGWTTATQTANRLLPTFSAATLQGTNTIYVVAADAIGNVDYTKYISTDYTFTSDAPDVPAALQATDSSDRASSRYSITLTWDAPADVGGGTTGYAVYRCSQHSTDCDAPDPVDEPPAHYTRLATTNTLGYLDVGLDNTVTYEYFVRTLGLGGSISGNSAVVAKKPEGKFQSAPALVGLPDVTTRIRSAIITWTTANDTDRLGHPVSHPATSFVQYGLTTSYGGETGTSDLVNDHSVTVVDLQPSTTYHYRLKWVDVDGNIGLSPDYVLTTLGAPSAPTSLHASPSSGTTNSFAFSWQAPNDQGVTIGKYYYSVNSTPTADNTTATTSTSVSAYAAATRQGANTFYVVAADDAGNINYTHYASVDFEVHTAAPSIPQELTITDSSNRDQKRYSITLTWDPPSTNGENASYTLYRSTDGSQTFTNIATVKSTGYLDTGLDAKTTYTYQVTASDTAGAVSAMSSALSLMPQGRYTKPASITEAPAAAPDSFTSTITWRTERDTSSFVDFGTRVDDLAKQQGTADMVSAHSVTIAGLQPVTTYYYRIRSIDVDQNITLSDILTFTTLEAPHVLDVQTSDIRLKDALITWSTNKESSAVLEYGPTTKYGLTYTDTAANFALKHTVKLEGLTDATLYHFRIRGTDRNGNAVQSDDYTFTTLTFPKISDISTKNTSQGQTEVRWKTNVPTSSQVEYYSTAIAPKTQGNTALVTDHVVLLFGLEDATSYTYKLHGSDQFGYEAVSDIQHFMTLKDTTPPQIFGIKSESNTIGSGETSKIQIVISWKTNEAATSKVDFGEGLSSTEFSDSTSEKSELVLDHLVVISDLTPAKTYHFRVNSRDKAGNLTTSSSYTVLTTQKRQSFLQLIVINLESTFSWLGNTSKLFGR